MPSGGLQGLPCRFGPLSASRLRRAGLFALMLLVPVLAGCLSPGLEEVQQVRRAGAPGAPPPMIDWRYVPANDRHDGSPYGVHLSFLEDPRSTLTVTWFTAGTTDVEPVVFYGEDPDKLVQQVKAQSHKAFAVPVMTHVATLRGLPIDTWIHYQVCGTTGCSQVFDAVTSPRAGADFRFALVADHGTGHASLNATGTLLSLRPDLVVFAGDTSYANGIQVVWDEYFHMHEPLFARVPIMTAPGNHEFRDGLFYDAYQTRFSLPNGGLWYGFTYSDVHFTFLEFWQGSVSAGRLSAQLDFFRHDLATTQERKDDGEVSFHFIVQHIPLYSNHPTRGDSRFNIGLQEDLVLAHEVDFLLVGHEHYYERSYPMAHRQPLETGTDHFVDPEGYIQVTSGGGGRQYSRVIPEDEWGAWTAVNERRHHVTEFEVADGQVKAWSWATDGTMELLDHFSVRKSQ